MSSSLFHSNSGNNGNNSAAKHTLKQRHRGHARHLSHSAAVPVVFPDATTISTSASSVTTAAVPSSTLAKDASSSSVSLAARSAPRLKHRIALVSDFFYPNVGGVEMHIHQLAQCLLRRGHKVVVITHSYNGRTGVRYCTNGMKVYYVPFVPFYNQNSFPTLFLFFPVFREILIKEQITLVHGHQAFSSLCHESILHASTMGVPVCFTDHSLFGFHDASSIHMNKFLKFTLSDVDHVVCVSHTSKENTVLRASLNPKIVSVIPNAVDTTLFQPNPAARDPDYITVVVMSRLVYRKGIDLIIQLIPMACARFPQLRFIIGGGGPMQVNLEEMRDNHRLYEQVEILGVVPHSEVRNVLVRGDIFLNASLTEAFCMAIVEAASCGLMVVSTKVGGVPEVLPPHIIRLAEPNANSLLDAVADAIGGLKDIHPHKVHAEVDAMYHWDNVAQRTEQVYDKVSLGLRRTPLIERIRRYYSGGPFAGILFCIVIIWDFLFYLVLEWIRPRSEIEIAPEGDFTGVGFGDHGKVHGHGHNAWSLERGK